MARLLLILATVVTLTAYLTERFNPHGAHTTHYLPRRFEALIISLMSPRPTHVHVSVHTGLNCVSRTRLYFIIMFGVFGRSAQHIRPDQLLWRGKMAHCARHASGHGGTC